jgi:hypothetical protein
MPQDRRAVVILFNAVRSGHVRPETSKVSLKTHGNAQPLSQIQGGIVTEKNGWILVELVGIGSFPKSPGKLASVAQSNGFNSASNAFVGRPTAILTLCNESIGRKLLDGY